MFISFKLKNAIGIVLIFAAILIVFSIVACGNDAKPAMTERRTPVLVLDAGHGGRDGGTVSESGIKESDINLDIALKTEALADFTGIKTVMTRSKDTDGAENGNYSERQNLLDRVSIINGTENAVLISIHQNNYPCDNVRGAEVMYAPTNGSEELALIIQSNLVSELDSENRRVARPVPDNLLITSSINCTGVLAECGFMSNRDEASKLSSYSYQLKIAEIFIASFLQFSSEITAK